VEDIIDTANTMSKLIPELMKQQPASLELAVLFVKREMMKYEVDMHYIGFEIQS
jgi:hypoxanthine phosphoribosyltransferase